MILWKYHLGEMLTDIRALADPFLCALTNTNSHLGVPSIASNSISEPTVRPTQTVHQSCIKSITISKQTELSFHLSLVT
jgi:hypothetical protein